MRLRPIVLAKVVLDQLLQVRRAIWNDLGRSRRVHRANLHARTFATVPRLSYVECSCLVQLSAWDRDGARTSGSSTSCKATHGPSLQDIMGGTAVGKPYTRHSSAHLRSRSGWLEQSAVFPEASASLQALYSPSLTSAYSA